VSTPREEFKPAQGRLAISLDKPEEVSKGGVFLAPVAQERACSGVVVARGDATSYKVGDHVFFTRYTGTEVEVFGTKRLIVKEDEILGMVAS
jgi:chaperonin GroES